MRNESLYNGNIWWVDIYATQPGTKNDSVMTNLQRFIFGLVFFILSGILLILQILFVLAIKPRCGYQANFAFVLLVSLGILDALQLSMHFLSACLLMSMKNTFELFYGFGAILQSCWIVSSIVTTCLPLHRLIWVLSPTKADRILSKLVLQIYLGVIGALVVFSLVALLTPFNGVTFIPEVLYWYYMGPYEGFEWLYNAFLVYDYYSQLCPPVIGSICNVIIIVIFINKRAKKQTIKDMFVAKQTIVYILYALGAFIVWSYVLPEFYGLPSEQSIYLDFLSNIIWIIYNGFNAIIYISFHKNIRQQMLRILCARVVKLTIGDVQSQSTRSGPLFVQNSSRFGNSSSRFGNSSTSNRSAFTKQIG